MTIEQENAKREASGVLIILGPFKDGEGFRARIVYRGYSESVYAATFSECEQQARKQAAWAN